MPGRGPDRGGLGRRSAGRRPGRSSSRAVAFGLPGRGRSKLLVLMLLLQLPLHVPGAIAPERARAQAASIQHYRLAEDWTGRSWQLTAGRYAQAADIASTDDGWSYILDRSQQALHLLAPDGQASAVLPLSAWLPDATWEARRIDGGRGGLWLLASDGRRSLVLRASLRAGQVLGWSRILETEPRYNDIAVHPDGRILLSRSLPRLPVTATPRDRGPGPKGGVDLFTAEGRFLAELDDRPLYYAIGVDVGPDARVRVVNRVPSPDSGGVPGPAPSPEPAGGRAGQTLRGTTIGQAAPSPQPGIVTYAPSLAWEDTWFFNAPEDVAAGSAGVFVSRQVEVFALGDDAPIWSGPTGQVIWPYDGGAPLHLESPARGAPLLASLAHCYTQGRLRFDAIVPGSQPQLSGALDAPRLAGPAFPLRIAAGGAPVLLQGRFASQIGSDGRPETLLLDPAPEPQSVQRWSSRGSLDSQFGLCGGLAVPWQVDVSSPWWGRDLALDRDSGIVYSLDGLALRARPDDGLPAWTAWPPLDDPDAVPPEQVAVDALGGRVAVLDAARQELRFFDQAGEALGRWPLAAGDAPPLLAVDLALGRDRVYVADAASASLRAYDLAGRPLPGWSAVPSPLPDTPAAIATGPDGTLFVLGRGGWAWRLSPEGQMVAFWRLPGEWGRDIAVGDDGRVYVAYARRERISDPRERAVERVAAAGIWVFEAETVRSSPAPEPGGCAFLRDKRAAPESLLLGGRIALRLEIGGACPGAHAASDLILLVDRSRSMSWDSALDRAREGASALLAELDALAARLGLVSFDDAGALILPLGSPRAEILTALARLQPGGDSRLGAGLDLARRQLETSDPAVRRRLVVLSDGEYTDSLAAPLEGLAAAGVDLTVLIYPVSSFDPSMARNLERLIGRPGSVHVAPSPTEIAEIARTLTGYRAERLLFETLTLTDEVPTNMRYLPGSAQPPAAWDPVGRRLTWRFDAVAAASGLSLTYQLEPLESGVWPTNVFAATEHRDGLGRSGRLDFPVPRVRVLERADLAWRVFLPASALGTCQRSAAPVDLVLAIDGSSSMAEASASGGSKLEAASAAAAALIGELSPGRDRVAILGFDAEARLVAPLSGDLAAAGEALAGLTTRPGTRIDRALLAAVEILAEQPRAGATRALVLLSDGRQSEARPELDQARQALETLGVRRFTVALGADADLELLAGIASAVEDAYVAPTAETLLAIYRALAGRLACGP